MPWAALFDRFTRQPRWQIAAELLAVSVLLVVVDALSGEAFALTMLYLPPVALAAWTLGGQASLFLSAGFAVSWLLFVHEKFGPAPYSAAAIWHALTILAVLWVTGRLAEGWRRASGGGPAARRDSLTGLADRQAFLEKAAAECNRGRRGGRPISLAFLDCDNFKKVNDTRGHLAGDEVLRTIARTLAGDIRSYDLAARMGGDEFALLFPDAATADVRNAVTRLHAGLNKAMKSKGWPVTFSIGVATFPEPPESPEEMLRAADELMYAAKRDGAGGMKFETIAGKGGRK